VARIFQELPADFQDYILQQIEGLKKLNKWGGEKSIKDGSSCKIPASLCIYCVV
jgi:hypothetical protein